MKRRHLALLFAALPVRPSGNGQNKSRPVLDGKTHTGLRVEMHETELGAGLARPILGADASRID